MPMIRKFLPLVTLALILAACGTVATPASQANKQETSVAQAAQETADAPTNTPIPPTATPVPPTATPEPPTEAPTEAPAADAASVSGDAANGETLFTTFQALAGFACNTCHLSISEDRLIGPGLLNIGSRAATRVDGQSAEEYLRIAIMSPNEYIVEGYPENLMPQTLGDIFNDDEINDLVAYLFSLEG